MTRLPEINEDTIKCGSFNVYTNGYGEVFISRMGTYIRISPGYLSDEILITSNSTLTVSITNTSVPCISCKRVGLVV